LSACDAGAAVCARVSCLLLEGWVSLVDADAVEEAARRLE